MSGLRLILWFLAAIPTGLVLMLTLGEVFDRMAWPIFHTWGLIHGSFLLAWPVLTLMSFAGLLLLDRRLWRRRS
jgi:hypothetical protein